MSGPVFYALADVHVVGVLLRRHPRDLAETATEVVLIRVSHFLGDESQRLFFP